MTLKAKSLIIGNREGTANIYKKNSYPHNSLGLIRFLWDSLQNTSADCQRKLWIFIHPSSIIETFSEMLNSFGIVDNLQNFDTYLIEEKKKLGSKELPSNKFFQHKYICSRKFQTEKIIIDCFHKRINRFRLTGPQSTEILKKVFRNVSIEREETDKEYWWMKYYDSDVRMNMLNKQKELFNSSHETLADGNVLAMLTGDPRLNPRKACENSVNEEVNTILKECSLDDIHISPLWNDDIREELRNKISDRDLNKLKEALTVAGKRTYSVML